MATNNATNTSNPITVAQGGTGNASTTAYAIQCGGTTSTGAFQTVASAGNAGQVLRSGGASAVPAWGGGGLVLLSSQAASSSAAISFTGITAYSNYLLVFYGVTPATDAALLNMQMSNDGGSTWITTSYTSGCNHNPYNSATVTNNNSTTAWVLTGPLDSGSSSNLANGAIYILNTNVGNNCYISGTCSYYDNTSAVDAMGVVGGRGGATGANAFKVLMSSGNIAAGTFRLYGVSGVT